MRDIEVQFLDEYKKADGLCTEAYGWGISEYISQMQEMWETGYSRVRSWKNDFYELKHLRWLRNCITHEAKDSECTADDVDLIASFGERFGDGSDPIALANVSLPARTANNADGSDSCLTHLLAAALLVAVVISIFIFIASSGACS